MRFNAIISISLFGFLILVFSATNHYSQKPSGKMV